jgi:cytochrome P450
LSSAARLEPPFVAPPAQPLRGLAFIRAFVRNPLEVIPAAVYREDIVPVGTRRIFVTSPSLIRTVLVDERDKFRKLTTIRLLGPLLGSGILTSEGSEWKWQRQAASPMFRPSELASFVPAFVRAAETRVASWSDGSVQAIDVEMTRATFDVLSATLLPSTDSALAPAIHDSLAVLQKVGGWDLLLASMQWPQWLPRPGVFSEYRAMRQLRGTVRTYVAAARARGDTDPSLAQRLIAARDPESGQSMDEERLVDNVLTFYLAGHETTAKALGWTLYLLALAPDWARALRDEVEEVTGGQPLRSDHIDRLALTHQVLQESMRLYPPVPIMSRQAAVDTELEGHPVRVGTSVLMPIYAIHRHVRRWVDPHAFIPGRFAKAQEDAMPRYQYMPFGAGPRVCIGRTFAMMEAAAMLATFVRRASFAPGDGLAPRPVARVTLIPGGGIPLRVTRL